MERITFVKASLLPSKNDGFHENAHLLYKTTSFYKKNSILHTFKKLKPQIWAFINKKTPFLELIETPEDNIKKFCISGTLPPPPRTSWKRLNGIEEMVYISLIFLHTVWFYNCSLGVAWKRSRINNLESWPTIYS